MARRFVVAADAVPWTLLDRVYMRSQLLLPVVAGTAVVTAVLIDWQVSKELKPLRRQLELKDQRITYLEGSIAGLEQRISNINDRLNHTDHQFNEIIMKDIKAKLRL